jgi:hypothetical protein
MSKNENQPAFPVLDSEIGAFGSLGLTKLEYAAIQIFQGYCANAVLFAATTEDKVRWSIKDADALFASLEAGKEPLKESPLDMLHAIVSHADQPEMSDAQFRAFARSNAQYMIDSQKGGENG